MWALSVPSLAWSRLAPDQPWPRARSFAAAFFDPASRSLYVHGGGSSDADAWRLSLDPEPMWTLLAPEQIGPPLPLPASAAIDTAKDQGLFFTGDQVWAYSFKKDEWSPLLVAGEAPPPRRGSVAVVDTKRERLVVYGGRSRSYPFGPLQEVWTLSLAGPATWSRLATRGDPAPALFDCAIYDPIRDRVLIGTRDDQMFSRSGVWAIPLGTSDMPEWQQIVSPADGLLPLYVLTGAAATYDSRRDRMLIFGGGYSFDGLVASNGCWALTLGDQPSWQQLSPPVSWPRDPSLPTPRAFVSAVYDREGDRLIVVGGRPGGFFYIHIPDDAWALALDSNRWTRLGVPTDLHPGWATSPAVYDARRDRTLVFQGDIVWALASGHAPQQSRPGVVPEDMTGGPRSSGLALGGAAPNPSAGEMSVRFVLPDAGLATLELLDLAGRLLWRQDVGPLGAGAHVVRVSPARPIAPGLYLLRLSHGATALTSKVVQLRE